MVPVVPAMPPMPVMPDRCPIFDSSCRICARLADARRYADCRCCRDRAAIGAGHRCSRRLAPGALGFGPTDRVRRVTTSSARAKTKRASAPTKPSSAPRKRSSVKPSAASASTRTTSAARNRSSAAHWARAADRSRAVIEAQNSTRVDAALYWKAYALDKLNQQADALAAVPGSDQALPAEPLDQPTPRRSSCRCARTPARRRAPKPNRMRS